jgi:16S rRNA (uracil1498-N3)-methyltransferase
MHLHRFILNFELNKEKVLIKDKEIIFQIRRVLRFRPGKKVILVNNNLGKEALAEILNFNDDLITVKILEVFESKKEYEKEVRLYISILKKENFELVCQKATEIGVKKITPLITEHTVKLNFKKDRILKIIKEAAEQSGRLIIPEFLEIQKFEDVVFNLKNNGLNLFFDPCGEKLKNFEKEILSNRVINIFIGPEGGWTEKEINLAKEKGFLIANLGNFTLRAETAAICSAFFIHLL